MTPENSDRWETTNEVDGDTTIYAYEGFLLKMQHLMGAKLGPDRTVVPEVDTIEAELITPEGEVIICPSAEIFAAEMKDRQLPLYLDSQPIAAETESA